MEITEHMRKAAVPTTALAGTVRGRRSIEKKTGGKFDAAPTSSGGHEKLEK